jgi:hypothetical protein
LIDYNKEKITVHCVDCNVSFDIRYDAYHRNSRNPNKAWRCKSCRSKYANSFNAPKPLTETHKQKIILSNKNRWKKFTVSKKQNILKKLNEGYEQSKNDNIKKHQKWWNTLTADEKESRLKLINEGYKKYWISRDGEQIEYDKKRLQNISRNFWNNDEYSEIRKNKSKKSSERYNSLSKQEKHEWLETLHNSWHIWWDSLTDKERSENAKRRWNNLSEEEKENRIVHLSHAFQDWYDNLSENEKVDLRKKQLSPSTGKNQLHQKFESYFNDSYISNGYYFKSEEIVIINNKSKAWDYGIYDKSNDELVMVVDLDYCTRPRVRSAAPGGWKIRWSIVSCRTSSGPTSGTGTSSSTYWPGS